MIKVKKFSKLILIQILVVSMVFCTIPFNVFSEEPGVYQLKDLELQVTVPKGYIVITRNTPESDTTFSKLGVTKSDITSKFESSNIYLNAISNIYNEEIVVTNIKSIISNFSLLSDTILNVFATSFVKQYKDYGVDVLKYEIYHHSQAKFIKVYFVDEENSIYGLQYYTIYGSKAMNFTMRSSEGQISARQESVMQTMVDSIVYDNAPPVVEAGEDTNSFIYTDVDSGVMFTVPANWEQKEFYEEREVLDAKFVSTKEDGCTMIYGSTDMWSQLSAFDKVGYNRSDINNSAFTMSDIAEMYSTTADKISTVTYNGVEYFKGVTNYTSDTYGVDITVTMTQLVYIDNGWMYMFQFGGTSTHKLYSDFESLLKSVQYPTISNVGGIGLTNNTSNNLNDNSDDNFGIVVVTLLIVVAVIVVAVVIFRKKNNELANCTPIYNTPTPESPSNSKPIIHCTKCGQALPPNNNFCHICGTKIEKEI